MQQAYYTRSRAALEYKAAGVLPFALHGATLVVLLGCEPTKTGPKGKVRGGVGLRQQQQVLRTREQAVRRGVKHAPRDGGPCSCPARSLQVWKYMWRDFGGARESADVDSAATAARWGRRCSGRGW